MAASSNTTTTTTIRVTRLEEKEELGSLNSRLAVYIEHMKRLKDDNARLTTELKTVSTRHEKTIKDLHKQYDDELALARRALDDIAKEKAEFQIKASKFEQKVDELNSQLEEEKAARRKLEDKLNKARVERDAAQAGEKNANAQIKKLQAELNKAEKELKEYKSLYEAECVQSEKEALLKVEHENTIQSLREELEFLKQTHIQEIQDTRTEIVELRKSRETIEVTLKRSYDDALARALQQARERFEEEGEQYRIELREWYASRTGADVGRGSDNDALIIDLRAEITELRSSNTNTVSELASSRARIIELEELIRKIEERHQNLRERYDKDCATKDARIKELLRLLREKELEYEELMDIRIALDAEIESYRKLLEGEESRLGIESPARRSVKRKTLAELESSSKRSRSIETETVTTSSVAIYARTETQGFIHIDELDLDGLYVKLTNTSNEDQDITGCTIKNINADGEEAEFKIPKSAGVLPAGQSTVVWAKSSHEKNDPPASLLWKKHEVYWVGVNCIVRVLSADGELLSETILAEEEERGELFDQAGDPSEQSGNDKCMIM